MKYLVYETKQFKRDLKKSRKRYKNLEKLYQVLRSIQKGIPLEAQYRKHRLWQSEYKGCFECHVFPDFLLVYRFCGDCLELIRCGSHADLF
jgi:mRNA interferase YafQ